MLRSAARLFHLEGTKAERWRNADLQQERGGRNVPTGMLYGTVVEHIDMSVAEMQSILVRLIGHPLSS